MGFPDEDRAPLRSVEILRRVRLDGYDGGKTALYELVAELRPRHARVMMRFEGLPGEFSQHDFGQVRLRYLDGTHAVVKFFGSRLKWSRWAAVDLVDGEDSETLVRTLAEHLVRFGGVPLCAVFDRPKTVALKWNDRGEVTEWPRTARWRAGVRLRGPGVGLHRGGVLAVPGQPEGIGRELGGLGEGLVLQAAAVPRS